MRKVEIKVLPETKDDGRRLKLVLEMLAEGIFSYLEKNGYFQEDEEKING